MLIAKNNLIIIMTTIPSLLLIILTLILIQFQPTYSMVVQIKVCQNKDCLKRFPTSSSSSSSSYDNPNGLIQILSNLIPPPSSSSSSNSIQIISSGCLGDCGKGPNIICYNTQQQKQNQQEQRFHAVNDVLTASAVLEVGCGDDFFEVPDVLLVATDAIFKAVKVTSTDKKLKLLTSVITSLSSSSSSSKEEYQFSNAMLHALTLRADTNLDLLLTTTSQSISSSSHKSITTTNDNIDFQSQQQVLALQMQVLNDINQALNIYQEQKNNHIYSDNINSNINNNERKLLLLPKIWRIKADIEESMGNYDAAMDAWRKWSQCTPSLALKAVKEIERISALK